jgi:DNA-directed RNA polymerase subunit M/transcription elongation factor TFIIS
MGKFTIFNFIYDISISGHFLTFMFITHYLHFYAKRMETLTIPKETRLMWIAEIARLASVRNPPIKYPLIFSRSLEHIAYQRRQTEKTIAEGVIVYRYGETDVLDIDSPSAHRSAALSHYTKMLRRTAWALHSTKMQSNYPFAWLDSSDDTLVEGTAHAEWEKTFFAQQDLAREVLSGKGNTTKGIFACTRCKSFDVDTEQKQTRSADEPMTIFCTCNVCGKRFVH